MVKRRAEKKSNDGIIFGLGFSLLFSLIIALIVLSPPPQTLNSGQDYFYGKLLEGQLASTISGTVQADTNCKPAPKGFTNCVAIIQADDGRMLRFNYEHDMSLQSCLASGERVIVESVGGGARVAR